MSKPIRFFYFDLGNVLLTFDHEIACRQIASLCSLPENRVRELIFESDLQEQYEAGQISTNEFFDQFCSQTKTRPNFDEFCFAASSIFQLNFPVVPIVTQLRVCGSKMGILSNTCEAHWNYILEHPFTLISRAFDQYILSFEVGGVKPDLKIFEHAIDRAGCDPDEIFFTDDRPDNVEGAVRAGMDAVPFISAEKLIDDLMSRNVLFNI